jgi:hypothetical protein
MILSKLKYSFFLDVKFLKFDFKWLSRKNSNSPFAGQAAGKFSNLCFKGLARKYSNSLFVQKAAVEKLRILILI